MADGRDAPDDELADLVAGALAGRATAWNALVERLQRVVWKSVNMMTTDHEIRDDAFAATWLRLAERLHSIREPEKLPGWLTTTVANEVRQILRQRGRDHLPMSGVGGSDDTLGDLFDRVPGDDEGDRSGASWRPPSDAVRCGRRSPASTRPAGRS